MKFECGNTIIDFRLNPGVYTDWSEDSSTGKTYTSTLLETLISIGNDNILVITYKSVEAAGLDKYINMIKNNRYDLIFADRADLYITDEFYNTLYKSGAIVYLDVKGNGIPHSYCGSECYIDFEAGRITYYVDDI